MLNSFIKEVPVSRSQSIDLLCKSMKWFLYGGDLRHEIVDRELNTDQVLLKKLIQSILIHSFPMDAFPTKKDEIGNKWVNWIK